MAWDDWIFATRGDIRKLEIKMNQQIADFKARMEQKLADANTKLNNITTDETGLKAKQAELEARIAELEAAPEGDLSSEDLALLTQLEGEQDAVNARLAEIDAAVPDAQTGTGRVAPPTA